MKASIALLLLAAACASEKPPAVRSYPPLAPLAEFVPAAALRAVALACAAAEVPDNGLDDDCDGSLDGERAGKLALVLAYPASLKLQLSLRSGAEERALPAASCLEASALCSLRLPRGELSEGGRELVLRVLGQEPSQGAGTVLVGVPQLGKIASYLANVPSGESELSLGRFGPP